VCSRHQKHSFHFFRSRPDRPWGPKNLLYNVYRVSLPAKKAAGPWRWPPTPSSAEVKESVELYFYSPLWAIMVCLQGELYLSLLIFSLNLRVCPISYVSLFISSHYTVHWRNFLAYQTSRSTSIKQYYSKQSGMKKVTMDAWRD